MAVRRLAEPHLQPKAFAFTAENRAWADQQIAKYPEGRQQSAVIPLLWRAQEQAGGWLPQKAIEHVADILGMANIRVLEVASFYTMFNLVPVGNRRFGEQMHVTADGKFSWVEVECLGACVNAPMAQINYDYYEDLTPESFEKILDEMAAGRMPKPGPQIGRQLSAPIGGSTTLTDPEIYKPRSGRGALEPALTDAEAKKPGEAANVRDAAVPKSPVGDSSRS
jgi:NADH-quinone oxidoreductase subunit E